MATKRHCCIPFCCSCFSLPNEKEHDPTPAGAQSAPAGVGKDGVDVDKLMQHISELFKLREDRHQKASIPSNFPWPEVPGLTKLKEILPFGTDLRNLKELLSAGLQCVSDLKDIISGPVKTLLKDIGQVSIATAGLLVVAYTLERFDDLSTNKEECWDLLKEMCYVATVVKRLKENSKGTQDVIEEEATARLKENSKGTQDVIEEEATARLKENSKGTQDVIEEEATALLVEGAIMCCTQIDSSAWKRFFVSSKIKADLSDIRQKLNVKYMQINIEIGFRVLSAIERKGRSPLSRKYPKHAVGIDESVKQVLGLLEIESEEKVVTVILHGFGGMGKTTLADAVFSQVGGCRHSHVQLFKDIDSKPDIEKLQTDILKHLMEPGEAVPEITKYQDGQRELGERLEKVHAFIYIDNVLKGDWLRKLLPHDMNTAKKVRFLLTARDEHVKIACPRSKIQIYKMEGIQHRGAMDILTEEIKDGINGDQFKNIIEICGGIPLMLTLTAPLIGRAENKKEAYETLMRQKDKWASEDFHEMRYAFAYDALPHDCKDPLLDICSYFKGWNWDRVEDIVGKDELRMLENRALVTRTTYVVASVHNARQKSSTRTTNVVASVHDVILTLARQKSEEESKCKELRLTFNSASKLKEFLKEKAEGIKGIWLSDNKDALEISATTLDFMSKSLRVLQLGILTKVEGKCREIFKKLVFFEAKITQLPFRDVSKLEQLRYLRQVICHSYEPNDLTLSKMPSSLRHMEFDGRSHSHVFQISSTDLEGLRNLRILRLVKFSKLTNLPEGLGDQLSGLQELSLSDCESIKKLPDSISKLRSLRILKMNGCYSLVELPVNFGSLSSLKELNLNDCLRLKALPDSVENLSSLTLLDLSCCVNLLNLPPGLGNLTSLVELDLMNCQRLESIPESIGELKQLQVLCMSYLYSLKELPHGFCNLSSITHLSMRNLCLEKLPDGFGQLASLKELDFEHISCLELPKGFGQLTNLEVLYLGYCTKLRELCNDFHCLSSLQRLNLSSCCELEGRSMDHMVNMNRLQVVHIKGSEQLVKRWAEIQRDGDGLRSFTVISGQVIIPPIHIYDTQNVIASIMFV